MLQPRSQTRSQRPAGQDVFHERGLALQLGGVVGLLTVILRPGRLSGIPPEPLNRSSQAVDVVRDERRPEADRAQLLSDIAGRVLIASLRLRIDIGSFTTYTAGDPWASYRMARAARLLTSAGLDHQHGRGDR